MQELHMHGVDQQHMTEAFRDIPFVCFGREVLAPANETSSLHPCFSYASQSVGFQTILKELHDCRQQSNEPGCYDAIIISDANSVFIDAVLKV